MTTTQADGLTELKREEVFRFIFEHLTRRDVPADSINRDATWQADLGIDSLDIVTLVQELEDEYSVQLATESTRGVPTVGALVGLVVEHLEKQGTHQ